VGPAAPAIGQVLDGCAPDPRQILGGSTARADGTTAPTWDWAAIPDLFSGKAGYPGTNLPIAATLGGRVAAIGPVPVHGARHHAHAFEASGLKDPLAGLPAAADLGYLDVEGIAIVPYRTPPGGRLQPGQADFNKELTSIRAGAERAVASVKTWPMPSEEGGRYRAPISKYAEMLAVVIGLFFFSNYYHPYE
jgi:DDE superfamily endonuclease